MLKPMWLSIPWIVVLSFFTCFSAAQAQDNLPGIIKKIEPSVVVILTYDKEGKSLLQGSGFFISKEGDIITNRHVIQGASRAEVKTAKGMIYPVLQVAAEDKVADIVRISLNIQKNTVQPLVLSNSLPETGERVIVIGSPLGLERTVSDGIVSAVRKIPEFGNIIQISAPISPGSSGSPVVNMKGEIIGVATFQVVEGQNLNFAVPSEKIKGLDQSKAHTLGEFGAIQKEEWLASAEGQYSAGLVLLWAEQYEKALSYFEDAVKKNPGYAQAFFQIGNCNAKIGRHNEAVEAYKQVISLKPDYAKAHLYLGVVCALLRRYSEAVEAYKQAIRLKSDDAEAHYNLGVAYNNLGRYNETVEAYKQAIRINPDYAEAHNNLGVAYDNHGRSSEAVESYKQTLRIKPDDSKAHYNMGVAYGKLGRYNEAVEAYKKAILIKPDDAEEHNNLGVTYLKLGHYSETVDALKQAIRLKPDYAEAHLCLGITYLILEDKDSALKEYQILKNLKTDLAGELLNQIYNYNDGNRMIKRGNSIFLDSVILGLKTLLNWHIWIGMISVGFTIQFSFFLVGLMFNSKGTEKAFWVKTLFISIVLQFFDVIAISAFIIFLLPTILSGSGFTTWEFATSIAATVFKSGLKAWFIITILSFIPGFGKLLMFVPGFAEFLIGILIFKPISQSLFGVLTGTFIPNDVYPGFFSCVGFLIIEIILTYLFIVILGVIGMSGLRNSYENKPTGIQFIVSYFIFPTLGIIPLLMYGKYVAIGIEGFMK